MSEQAAPETTGVMVELLATVDLGPEISVVVVRREVPAGTTPPSWT